MSGNGQDARAPNKGAYQSGTGSIHDAPDLVHRGRVFLYHRVLWEPLPSARCAGNRTNSTPRTALCAVFRSLELSM